MSNRKPVRLCPLTPADETEFVAFYDEFMQAGGRIHPGVLRKYQGNFPAYLALLEEWADSNRIPPRYVASDTLVLKDDAGRIYGMVSLRHALSDDLLVSGGHIGYGIRPSERGKGYGTRQLALALETYREWQVEKVLVTCDKANLASAKVARNNGGVLEDEIVEKDGNILQRYWITLI
ncbi:MAG: GNAT family N-acetyltransferase [Oscillospiraceae bacterium]|nr:GNAT family N-acetyltransferase [Oscillospiraceae bacterium]